jgi:CheY-like chemotaxis protein
VDLAANGEEALEAFKRYRHRLLLMDLHMPVMDGKMAFGELERLCERERWAMPAVVFCTGFAPPDAVKHVVAGDSAHCLLFKPVKEDILVDAVRSRLA